MLNMIKKLKISCVKMQELILINLSANIILYCILN